MAGPVLEHLHEVPVVGDDAVVDGRRLTVIEMDGRRIARCASARLDEDLETKERST